MRGIVACETLYPEIEALAPDAEVRYLPHDLHEFPVNVGDDRKIGRYVREAVAAHESAGVSSIAIAFAGRTGLDGLQTESVPLAVSLADDCVSTLRYRAVNSETGEAKDPGVYYLTRGGIDRAVDAYKLSLAYRGQTARLMDRFDQARAAHPDLVVDWAEGDLYERAVERSSGMNQRTVDRFFAEVLGFYDTVDLVDTGSLYEVHHWYADQVADYIEALADGEKSVTRRVSEGDLGLLERLLTADRPEHAQDVAVYEAGEPVEN